jgi:hypothetical protein
VKSDLFVLGPDLPKSGRLLARTQIRDEIVD